MPPLLLLLREALLHSRGSHFWWSAGCGALMVFLALWCRHSGLGASPSAGLLLFPVLLLESGAVWLSLRDPHRCDSSDYPARRFHLVLLRVFVSGCCAFVLILCGSIAGLSSVHLLFLTGSGIALYLGFSELRRGLWLRRVLACERCTPPSG